MACCVTDEVAKVEGASGCGCSSTSATSTTSTTSVATDATEKSVSSAKVAVNIVTPLTNRASLPGIKIVAATTSCCAPAKS